MTVFQSKTINVRLHWDLQWMLSFRMFSMILILGKGDTSMLRPPSLNITQAFIDVKVNSTLYLQCTGEQPLSWAFKYPMDQAYMAVDGIPSNIDYSEKYFESVIGIHFTSYLQTGEYLCYYSNMTTSLYIYVNDNSELLMPMNHFLILREGDHSIIPCRPTHSETEVSLWKVKHPTPDRIQLNDMLTYNPTLGFELRNTTKEFMGDFYCLGELQDRNQSLLMNIDIFTQTESIPEVLLDDSDAKYVLLNSSFSLKCNITVKLGTYISRPRWSYPGSNEDRITISRRNIKRVGQNRIESHTLTVKNAQKNDEGVYRCNVTDHSNRENYDEVEVKIFESPLTPVVNFSKSYDIIIEDKGEKVDLKAHYTVFPQTSAVQSLWIKDNYQLPPNNKYIIKQSASLFTLEIQNLSRSDSGLYTVQAHSQGASYNRSLELRVKDKPIILIHNAIPCCYVPGASYLLHCEAQGYPLPNLSWYWKPLDYSVNITLSNNWVNVDEVQQTINNSTQWIMNIDKENVWSMLNVTALHSGYYKCSGTNEIGTTEEKVQFIVSGVDEGLTIEVSDKIPLEMEPFFITCKASSQLYSELQWMWIVNNVTESVISTDVLTKSNTSDYIALELKFDAILKNQSGSYVCLAELRLEEGLEQKSVLIKVREIQEPRFLDSNWDSEIVAEPNSVLELQCEVYGVPFPNITWYRDDELLCENITGGKFEDNFQRLIISRLVEEDSGRYSCLVQNVAGMIMRSMSLSVNSNSLVVSAGQSYAESTQIWKYIAASVAAILMFILLLVFGRWAYRRKNRQLKLQGFNHHLFKEGQMDFYDPNVPLDDQVDLLPYDTRWEFPKENLKFGRTLGQGAFGRVVKAEAVGLNDYETSTAVAVKMLKEKSDLNQQKALIAELKILIHLGHHVNIVNLMGAVTKNISQGELLVMVEYCRYGNLRYYLLRHRESFVNDVDLYNKRSSLTSEDFMDDSNATMMTELKSDVVICSSGSGSVFAVDNPNYRQRLQSIVSTDAKGSTSGPMSGRSMSCSSSSGSRYYCRVDSHEHVITTSDLLCYSFQCASGMTYLASKKLIHRDLAARNVLLTDDKTVKICDFGLAKDCYKYENYVKKGDGPLPIKWMAIESIRDHVFTTKSDVWSFGILMWEFFTLGNNPYPGIEIDEEFYKRLTAGYRLQKPINCPDHVYEIMQNCWLAIPDERPDFSQLSDILGGLLDTGVKQHYIDLNAPYMEMNCKMQKHDYSNMPVNVNNSDTRLYMNSEVDATCLYDNLPSISRSIFDDAERKEATEFVPMIQLETIEENEVFESENFQKQRSFHSSDYLRMGDAEVSESHPQHLEIKA